jgi:glycosyltransferase involved in cell wall biosynthesis
VSSGLRITAIVAVYNEADIIGQTVGDLVRQRIHVHVLDNLSTDDTVRVLESYASSGLVHVERFPIAGPVRGSTHRFEYARIMLRKQELARELESDWFIAHDADEFRESPWAHLSLREGIERVDRAGWNAINFAVLNFWPTNDGFDPLVDIREAFRYYEVGAPWDLVQVKCWKKASDVDLVSNAGHDAQFALRRVFPLRFILRHYPIRSQAHGMRKVFEERRPGFLEEERQRGWHVQYDDISAGHKFLREPATLTEFNPERTRVDSLIEDLGAIQTTLDEHQRRSLDLQNLIDLQATHLRDQQQQLDRQITDLKRLSAALSECHGTVAQLQSWIDHHQRDLANLLTSRSWRLTAPLRAIWRLLGLQ